MAGLSGCRSLHRRYERKAEHFLAFAGIACMLTFFRRLTKEDEFSVRFFSEFSFHALLRTRVALVMAPTGPALNVTCFRARQRCFHSATARSLRARTQRRSRM